jgi:hypothetical protein
MIIVFNNMRFHLTMKNKLQIDEIINVLILKKVKRLLINVIFVDIYYILQAIA